MTPGFDGLFANSALLLTPATEMMPYLPAYVAIWVGWMVLTGLVTIIWSIRQRAARPLAAAWLGTFAAGPFLPSIIGEANFTYAVMGIVHAVLWTPAIILTLMRRDRIEWRTRFGIWMTIVLATMIFSLIFDWRDSIAWLSI